MKTLRKNNQGLTLVELLVTFAILLIVMGSIITFLVTTTTLFKSSNTETDIQNEAQLAGNRIHDMLISASAGVTYYYVDNTTGVKSQVYQDPSGTASAKALYVYNWEDNPTAAATDYDKKVMIYCIIFNPDKQELDYISYNYTTDSSGKIVEVDPLNDESRADETNILSKYVTDFSVKLYDPSAGAANTLQKNQVYYKITFTLNGKNYTAENTVTLRNDIEINRSLTEVAVTPPALVSTVQLVKIIQPTAAQVVVPASSLQFKARVTGLNLTNDDVTWQCTGQISTSGTSINTDGLLTVGSDETSQNIQVVAISKENTAVKSDPLVVSTSYMQDVSLSSTVTFDSKTRKAEAALTITGKNLIASQFSSQITAANFTVTDGTNTVTDCTVTNLQNTLTTAETLKYSFTIDASGAAAGLSRTLKLSVTYPENITTKNASLTFTTPAIPALVQPITDVQIVRTLTGRGGPSVLWRGETGTYKVQIKRQGDNAWKDTADDSNCSAQWYLDSSAKAYVTLTNANTGTATVTVSKSSKAKSYKASADFQLGVTVTDAANTGTKTETQSINVPAVTMQLVMKTENGIKYDNYIANEKESEGNNKNYINKLVVSLSFSGLALANDELSNYLRWYNDNSYEIVKAQYTDNYFELKVTPKSGDSRQVSLALGDKLENLKWNDLTQYNPTGYVSYKVKQVNLTSNSVNYIPFLDTGTYYTSEGKQYVISDLYYDTYYRKYYYDMTFDGNDYYYWYNDTTWYKY